VFDHAYHGRTNLTMALTAKAKPYKHRFGPFAPEIYRVPMSYPLRDGGLSGPAAAARAIDMIEKQVGSGNVAAVLIEPIQGEGGFVVPAPGFLPAIAEWARGAGAVFVADEIQTGFCRTGAWFATEHEAVEPDLVTTAKGMGGGLPIAGVVGRAELMDAVHAGGLGGTYGGNPVACAASLATIRLLRDGLMRNAEVVGAHLFAGAKALMDKHAIIGDVRGRGLMIGIEFVKDRQTKERAISERDAIVKACFTRGLLVLGAGRNAIRLSPPLVLTKQQADTALEILDQAIASQS